MNIIQKLVEWGAERGIIQQKPDTSGFISNIVEELAELKAATQANDWQGQVDAIDDIIVFCMTELPKYGANPERSLEETYKEINSRTGAWSDEHQKWMKFKTPEAKALWYTAVYTRDYHE